MVEIRAAREGRELHNFAAFLARVAEGRIVELWIMRRTIPADAEPTRPVLAPAHPRPAPRRTSAE